MQRTAIAYLWQNSCYVPRGDKTLSMGVKEKAAS